MPTSTFAAGAYASVAGLGGGKTMMPKPVQGAGAITGDVPDFSAMVKQAVRGVGEAGARSDAQVNAAATGQADLVQVVTAVAESEAAIESLVAVRDRVIAAYEEIMRMQV
jgi:flagellar hook-basal body complex protein FliE